MCLFLLRIHQYCRQKWSGIVIRHYGSLFSINIHTVALKQILSEIYKYINNVDALDAPNDIFVIFCDKIENNNIR